MSSRQIAREAIKIDHEVIYEVAANHNWRVEDVREKQFFLDAVEAHLFPVVQVGIFMCEKIFGMTITNSAGKKVMVRYIGEQHVKEDLGRIPSVADWLRQIQPERWMGGQKLEEPEAVQNGSEHNASEALSGDL